METSVTKAVSILKQIFPDGSEDTIAFRIENAGCVMVDRNGVAEGEREAALTVQSDARTLGGILNGELDPAAMYLSGRLRIYGDMQLAMRLTRQLG